MSPEPLVITLADVYKEIQGVKGQVDLIESNLDRNHHMAEMVKSHQTEIAKIKVQLSAITVIYGVVSAGLTAALVAVINLAISSVT